MKMFVTKSIRTIHILGWKEEEDLQYKRRKWFWESRPSKKIRNDYENKKKKLRVAYEIIQALKSE